MERFQNQAEERLSAMEAALAASQAESEKLRQERAQERQEADVKRELGTLSEAHPDWKEVNDSQEFGEWFIRQSPGIQALHGSMSADDNIALLDYFKQSTHRAPAPDPNVSRTAARRERALQTTAPRVRQEQSRARGNEVYGSDREAEFASLTSNDPFSILIQGDSHEHSCLQQHQ